MPMMMKTQAVPSARSCAEIERAASRPRSTVADVSRFMADVQPYLEALGTPAAHFNRLYADITGRVQEREASGRFENPDFLVELDLQFAKRYVRAMLGWLHDDGAALSSWLLVFEPDLEEEADALISATLGVNAHINADLTFALLGTYRKLGIEMRRDSPEHRDYLAVNTIFHEAIPPLRAALGALAAPHPGIHHRLHPRHGAHVGRSWLHAIGLLTDDVENWFADLIVDSTRDQAWEAASFFYKRLDDRRYLSRQEEILDYVACSMGVALGTPEGRALLTI